MSASYRPQRVLPPDVRHQLAQVEAEYQSGELTQRGYEMRRSRILSPIDLSALSLSLEGTTTNNVVGSVILFPFQGVMVEWEC